MAEIQLSDLNERAAQSPERMIEEAEIAYNKSLLSVANAIFESNARLLLLSGPSGAGKTTSANIIADLLRARGKQVSVVSLDDFYRPQDDPDYPRLQDGTLDYECVDSLQISLIHHVIEQILSGKQVMIPKFDFKQSISIPNHTKLDVDQDSVVVFEGLHALNPRLTQGIGKEGVFRLFISVSTNLCDGAKRILSGKKIRFMRRLVRDSIYRSASADRTLSLWKNVLHGEELYLYPYRDSADYHFNTFHDFELGALATMARELLEKATIEPEFVSVVLSAINQILPIDQSLIPQTSLIREFIPGGRYENLY